MKIKDTDYLYATARVRSLETRLITREAAELIADATSVEDALKIIGELGYGELGDNPLGGLEKALADEREETFSLMREISPSAEIVDVFSLKFDYHNLKAIIKASALGQSADSILIDAGQVPAGELKRCLNESDFSKLTPSMAEAATDARDTLARTGDPQLADFILDRAYFSELIGYANRSGSEFLSGYVRLMVDIANLRSTVRAQRQGKAPSFIRSLLIGGGNISADSILADTKSAFASTPLSAAADEGFSEKSGFTAFERMCDDALMEYLRGARYMAFGDAPLIAYLAACENQISLIRILLTAKLAGLPAEEIRERLRETYV